MSPSEMDLRATLRDEAERIDTPGNFAAAAMAIEHRARRRRVTAGALGGVLALAVAAPLVYSSMTPESTQPVPATSTTAPEATTPAPTPSDSTATTMPSPTASPTGSATSAPAAATPATAYALDDTIRVGDRVIGLAKGTVVENLAVLANGGFVLQSHMATGSSNSEIELLSPEGRVIKALGMSGFYVVSRDGTRILVKSGTSTAVVVLAPDGTVVGQRTDSREPAAVVGEFAYLNGPESSLEWNVRTGQTRTLPGHLVAVSDDRTRGALQWEVDNADGMSPGCWAVVDLASQSFPKLLEKCGEKDNPMYFMPGSFSRNGTYLVGSNFIDGGYWFSAGVVQVSDGTMVVGTGHNASGWSWRLEDDEQTLLISRNTSTPLSPTTHNALQRCTLSMECTNVQPELELDQTEGPVPGPRYVVPK